ncbi:hypothetical protein GCM10027026_35830 [Myroides odoratimimus subsp. xuanwuensis]
MLMGPTATRGRRYAVRVRVAGVLVAILLGGLLTGCTEEDDTVDAAQRLEQQRDDVRARAGELIPSLARRVDAQVAGSDSRFEGCTTAGPDWTYRDFSYGASARLDGLGERTVIERLGAALEDDGYVLDEPSAEGERTVVTATRDDSDVRVQLTEYAGKDHFVVVGLRGRCVEVPEDQREAWGERQGSDPLDLG